VIDELDRRLLNALQMLPRASWRELSAIAGATDVTLQRRWARLKKERIAWMTASCRTGHIFAHVQFACELRSIDELTAALSRDPRVLTVHISAGDYAVLATIAVSSLGVLTDFVGAGARRLPGVLSVRCHVQTTTYLDGSGWDLAALPDTVRKRVLAQSLPPAPHTQEPLDEREYAIYRALFFDGRASATHLAKVAGVGVNRAREILASLLEQRRIRVRCEVARPLLGMPVAVNLHASCATDLRQHARAIRDAVPELALIVRTAGHRDLHVYLWMPALADMLEVERRLLASTPGLRIGERIVILRTVKLAGHLRDEDGRLALDPDSGHPLSTPVPAKESV